MAMITIARNGRYLIVAQASFNVENEMTSVSSRRASCSSKRIKRREDEWRYFLALRRHALIWPLMHVVSLIMTLDALHD